jgi:hypothetical protein
MPSIAILPRPTIRVLNDHRRPIGSLFSQRSRAVGRYFALIYRENLFEGSGDTTGTKETHKSPLTTLRVSTSPVNHHPPMEGPWWSHRRETVDGHRLEQPLTGIWDQRHNPDERVRSSAGPSVGLPPVRGGGGG